MTEWRVIGRLALCALVVVQPWTAHAQTVSTDFLVNASLEELMNIRVTSAERREQRMEDVAAAVDVITQDDIRRSGHTKLPEILRLVPGVQVARINASEWAVSVRGFNGMYSDKLLVLIDGRSIYNRGFSGVFWDNQNLMVADIDRIEVIRGPGGTSWGANAVNGVINVITKSAADTQGTAVEVGAGTFEQASGAIRHGGQLGDVAYRVFGQWLDHDQGVRAAHTPAGDNWEAVTVGSRMDWSRGANSVMATSTYMNTRARPQWLRRSGLLDPPVIDDISPLEEGSGLARWTHRRSDGSLFTLQGFAMLTHRHDSTMYAGERKADVEAQYQTAIGPRHQLVAGGGYRHTDLSTRGSATLHIDDESASVFNGFVQDAISLGKAVTVTVGSKLEHDTFAGWGLLPSARIMWDVGPSHQRVWGAVSRARRTPSAAYRTMRLYQGAVPGENGVPVAFVLLGNPDYESEELLSLEGGYRVQLGTKAAIDVAVFRGYYDNSTTIEPRGATFELDPPPAHVAVNLQYGNLLSVESTGFEVDAHWSPFAAWRVDASYAQQHFTPTLDPMSQDTYAAAFDGAAPRHQWQVRSMNQVTSRLQFNGAMYRVGELQEYGVPAYTRADASLEFKLTPRLAVVGSGQSLLQPSHVEFSDLFTGLVGSRVPRSGRLQLRWQF